MILLLCLLSDRVFVKKIYNLFLKQNSSKEKLNIFVNSHGKRFSKKDFNKTHPETTCLG